MSNPHLPAEILDHVVHDLCDTEDALRICCPISKSWTPRTRKYLFADVKLQTRENINSRRKMFPDPSTSPGYYTKTLSISFFHSAVAANTEAGGWIGGFTRVVRFVVDGHGPFTTSLAPFYGFSPVKSLHVDVLAIPPQFFDLILSFPLLEDLAVRSYRLPITIWDRSNKLLTLVQPSSSPVFSGTLKLSMGTGMEYIARKLLSLPGGIHFRELALTWVVEEDGLFAGELVEGCSRTLESLEIIRDTYGTPIQHLSPHR